MCINDHTVDMVNMINVDYCLSIPIELHCLFFCLWNLKARRDSRAKHKTIAALGKAKGGRWSLGGDFPGAS